ncbi:MAG: hypothetical protein PHI94_05665 [Eubacteriaceae bacterium]|nr:hypothetical protein [Eubacteriaceae bacterium]MDD4508740.1 hypothetical protein [Eubacteriaceae bacterium]
MISRFLTLYLANLVMACAVMVPGLVVTRRMTGAGVSFVLTGILGTLLLSLLPMTVAALIGAGITALSSRMRHRSMVSLVLTMAMVGAVVVGQMLISGQSQTLPSDMITGLAKSFPFSLNGYTRRQSGLARL